MFCFLFPPLGFIFTIFNGGGAGGGGGGAGGQYVHWRANAGRGQNKVLVLELESVVS